MPITHTITLANPDGTTQTHTAEAADARHESDGCIAVMASCCNKVGAGKPCPECAGKGCAGCDATGSIKDEDTRSWHAFYDVANMSEQQMQAEVQGHVQRVAEKHVARQKATSFIATLVKAAQPAPPVIPAIPPKAVP